MGSGTRPTPPCHHVPVPTDATDPQLATDKRAVRMLRIRLQLFLSVMLVGTHVIGAVVVFAISLVVVPGGLDDRLLDALWIAVPVYVAIAVLVAATALTRSTLTALRWVLDRRPPDDDDRRRALRLAWRMTLVQLLIWVAATVLFTLLAVWRQPSAVLATAFAVGIAGIVVSAIAYLFAEYALRPVAARALLGQSEAEFRTAGVRRRMVLFWLLGTAAPLLGLVVSAIVALSRPDDSPDRLAVVILSLSGVVLVFGLLVTVLNAGAVTRPIRAVREAMSQVARGDLDVKVRVDDGTELGLLQAGFNDMADGLRERERIRDLFGRHVGEQVAAAATGADVELGGQTVEVSVLMIDLVGSTTFAVEHEPQEVVSMLNRFFEVVVAEVDRHDGLVNKFMGDAVLAIYGAPVDLADHAGAALATARAIIDRIGEEVPEIGAGIGVATGTAVAGNVGASSRFEYTVIGDAVNTAARLTELAKEVEGQVLVARASVDAAGDDEASHWSDDGDRTLRGRADATDVCVLARP